MLAGWFMLPAVVLMALTVGGMVPFVPGAAPPAPAATRVRMMQFNLCGSICNGGEVDRPGEGNDVVEHIRDLIGELQPDVVVLNEVCRAQLDRLVGLLARRGHPMASTFHPQRRADQRCPPVDGERGFGDAVLAAGPTGAGEVHPLPNPPGGEDRAILCLRVAPGPRFLVCAVHLVAGDAEYRRRQLAELVRFSRRRAQTDRLVVAGDFNSYPRELRRMSDPSRDGHFEDVDAGQNRPTHARKKIDYIFFERAHFHSPRALVRSSPYSDHRILFGAVSIN